MSLPSKSPRMGSVVASITKKVGGAAKSGAEKPGERFGKTYLNQEMDA